VPLQVVDSAGNFNIGLTGFGLGPMVALTPGIVSTVAGNGTAGYSGDGGAATSAALNAPNGIAVDNVGNLYISDWLNNRIRKIDAATGIITTVAGNGTAGYSGDGGPATSAEINWPQSITFDAAGNLYFADGNNHVVRKVNVATGIISTYAGNGTGGYSGDGGPATSAELDKPAGTTFDNAGNLYIADDGNSRIRKVAAGTGIITTVAGNGTTGYAGDGGPATSAKLNNPYGVVFDSKGNFYIPDVSNQRIRKVDTSGVITTYAGNGTAGYSGDGSLATSAAINNPYHIGIDAADNIYIGDLSNRLRKIDAATGIITTIAGTGTSGFSGDGGPATSANLSVGGIAFDIASGLYFPAATNRIRKIDLSQSALSYPTLTTVGTSDATDDPQTAIVSNIGNASLTVPPPSSGSNPNVSLNFALDAATTCPQESTSSSSQTLAAGANCKYAVNFVPTTAGALTGSGVLTDNSLNAVGSTQTIHLNGTGIAASTTTTVSSSLNPSAYQQSITFTEQPCRQVPYSSASMAQLLVAL
jgi:sugar lactone lactonase YvrE